MLPKVIHYCWFGGNPKPELALKCIESWKKYCPDFEIKEWNENNFDVDFCEYTKQAYKEKKWAFVSDVARYKILHDNGGLYFDTDVEVVRPLEFLLEDSCFLGWEDASLSLKDDCKKALLQLNPGLAMGCEKGNTVVAALLMEYDNRSFYKADGSLNLETICIYSSQFFYKNGMKSENSHQNILGVHIYPKNYFNPMDRKTGKIHLTEETVSVHHYAASWTTKTAQRNVKLFRFFSFVFGKRVGKIIRVLYRKWKGK